MRYFRPYVAVIAVIILLHFVAVYFQLDLINITLPMINDGAKKKNIDLVLQLGGLMLLMILIYAIDRLVVSYLSSWVTGKVIRKMRRDVYSSLLRAEDTADIRMTEGSVMTVVTSDLTAIENYVMSILNSYSYVPIMLIGLLLNTVVIDLSFTLIIGAAFLFISAVVWIAGRRLLDRFTEQQECLDRVNEVLKENITGVRTIRAENKEDYQTAKFDKVNTDYGRMNRIVNMGTYYLQPFSLAVMNIVVVVVCVLFALESNEYLIEAGKMVVLFQYVAYLLACVSIIPFLSVVVPRMVPLGRRISNILSIDGVEDIGESPDVNEEVAVEVRGGDVVKNGRMRANDLTFTIKKGEVVAIVGNDVCGKDSIAPALLGFSEISNARIGGKDMSQLSRTGVRSYISYVADKAQLFRDSFQTNIDPSGTCDPERIAKAIEASRFSDVIAESPRGLRTLITNEGNSISGGQRQKLAIARCLAKDAELYIFDRCLHSLDLESKLAVTNGIMSMTEGKAVLIITNYVSLAHFMDRIYVMHEGTIVASGKHEELIETCQPYRDLFDTEGY